MASALAQHSRLAALKATMDTLPLVFAVETPVARDRHF